MSKEYDKFRTETLEAEKVITKASQMGAVSDDFEHGFHRAMWEAREIFMKLEDSTSE